MVSQVTMSSPPSSLSAEHFKGVLPESLLDLPFGSPEFKDANERIGREDMDRCAEVMRAMPSWVNLTGTTVCNLKCVMCTHGIHPETIPRWFMTDEVYERVVAELYPFAKIVQFSAYGEPLMTPRIESKLDDLERTHTKLDIVTNGSLMKGDRFRERLLRALGHVTFSLDGATAATYNSLRIGSDFDRVMGNIRAFCSLRMGLPEEQRPRLAFNYILMKRTIREAPEFVELAASLGAQQITFNHLVVFDESLKEESLLFDTELSNRMLGEIRETADRLGVPITMPPLFQELADREVPVESTPTAAQADGPGLPPVKCMFLWQRVYVSVNGDVVPCCLAGVPMFGNMMPEGFMSVWNGPTYQTHRRHVYTSSPHGMCASCYLIYPAPDQVEEAGFFKY